MPVPGPRNQFGPDPGYTNPQHEKPTRFNMWGRPAPVAKMGETPALMYIDLRGEKLGVGQIRHLWKQAIGYIPAQAPYSWTANRNDSSPIAARGFQITRNLRYMTRSLYMGSGIDNTRFAGLHTAIMPKVRSMPVTLGSGLVRSRPTVRNRITSFGSRVPPINSQVVAAEDTAAS